MPGDAINARLGELKAAYDGTCRAAYLAARLRDHVHDFPWLAALSDDEVEMHFLASLCPPGFKLTTTLTDSQTLRTYRIRWSQIEEVEQRIAYTRFHKGLAKMAKIEPPAREKVYPSAGRLMVWADRAFQIAAEHDKETIAFWAVLVLTGARPNNLAHAPVFILDERSVAVRWIVRKGNRTQARGHTEYLGGWSCYAPGRIATWLQRRHSAYVEDEGPENHHPFWRLNPATAASCVWNALRRYDGAGNIDTKGWTSTTPRDVMARRQFFRYKQGDIDKATYEWLMDHTLETGRAHYIGEQ